MKNYICLNGQKIKITDEVMTNLRSVLNINSKRLGDIPAGDTCKIGEYEFIVLEHASETTALLLKDTYAEKTKFSNSNNDYRGSIADKLCTEFAEKIADIAGKENLIEHTVDLTSDDGLKDYGKIKRFSSLITADLYRRYVDIIDRYKLDKYFWLSTPHSTSSHDNDQWVKCVSPRGGIYDNYYDYYNCGVRPFCILNSNIFVS